MKLSVMAVSIFAHGDWKAPLLGNQKVFFLVFGKQVLVKTKYP